MGKWDWKLWAQTVTLSPGSCTTSGYANAVLPELPGHSELITGLHNWQQTTYAMSTPRRGPFLSYLSVSPQGASALLNLAALVTRPVLCTFLFVLSLASSCDQLPPSALRLVAFPPRCFHTHAGVFLSGRGPLFLAILALRWPEQKGEFGSCGTSKANKRCSRTAKASSCLISRPSRMETAGLPAHREDAWRRRNERPFPAELP